MMATSLYDAAGRQEREREHQYDNHMDIHRMSGDLFNGNEEEENDEREEEEEFAEEHERGSGNVGKIIREGSGSRWSRETASEEIDEGEDVKIYDAAADIIEEDVATQKKPQRTTMKKKKKNKNNKRTGTDSEGDNLHSTVATEIEKDDTLFQNWEEREDATEAAQLRAEEKKSLRQRSGHRRCFDVSTFHGISAAVGGEPTSAGVTTGMGEAGTSEAATSMSTTSMWGLPKEGEEKDGLFDLYCRLNYMRTHQKAFKTPVRGSRRNKEIDELYDAVEALKVQIADHKKRNEGNRKRSASNGDVSDSRRGSNVWPRHIAGTRTQGVAHGHTAATVSSSSSSSSSSLRVTAVELELQRRRLARLRAERSVDLRDDLNLLLRNIDDQLVQLLPGADSLELRAQKLDSFSWKTPMWIGYRPLLLLKHKENYYHRWLKNACPDPPHTLMRILRQQQQQQEEEEKGPDETIETGNTHDTPAAAGTFSDMGAAEEGKDKHQDAKDGEGRTGATDTADFEETIRRNGETLAAAHMLQHRGKQQQIDGDEYYYFNEDDLLTKEKEAEEHFFPFDAERQFELEEQEVEMHFASRKQRAPRVVSSLTVAEHDVREAPQEASGPAQTCRNTEDTRIKVTGVQQKEQATLEEKDLQILEEKRRAAIAKRQERLLRRRQQ